LRNSDVHQFPGIRRNSDFLTHDLHHSGIGHVLLNVANITTVSRHVEVDVALHTPASAPGVSHNPVSLRNTGVGVANSLNAVVNRARAGLHDTASVGLPLLGSNADGNGTLSVKHVLELAPNRRGVALIIGHWVISLASWAEFAGAGRGNAVRINTIGVNAVAGLDSVGVSIMGPATIAAIVGIGACSALLNTQNLEFGMSNSIEGLNSLVSTMSPAGTAVALVFDRSNNTLGAPVHIRIGSRKGELIRSEIRSTVSEVLHEASVHKFLGGEISQTVDSKDGVTADGNVLSIQAGNLNKTVLENLKAMDEFLKGIIVLLVLHNEVVELSELSVRESSILD
jgi:hypothetical protein